VNEISAEEGRTPRNKSKLMPGPRDAPQERSTEIGLKRSRRVLFNPRLDPKARSRSAEERFVDQYRGQLRPFEAEYEVAPGVVVCRTGGHTPGHSVVRLGSGGDRLTFLGDAVFPDHFDRPDWYNAFDHDPEEAVRVRVRLLRELAATREPLVAAHLSFPSVGRVAVAGDVFRFVPAIWEY
jgi:glyoxylase-like metal-dependent hydrolase (beta-lactamase superfamily II)